MTEKRFTEYKRPSSETIEVLNKIVTDYNREEKSPLSVLEMNILYEIRKQGSIGGHKL